MSAAGAVTVRHARVGDAPFGERTDEVFGVVVAEARYRRRVERPPGDPAPGRG